jgi:cyclic pyranopterin phosphate synthase
MVEVGGKPVTARRAVAEGWIATKPEVVALCLSGRAPKGDVLAVARVAGILGAKRTAEWIPLAHPVALTGVEVDITPDEEHGRFRVVATVHTRDRTGVEMEALTAVTAALLTLYDMLKAVDRAMEIGPVRLVEKSGGRSGHFVREGMRGDA